MQYVQRAVVVLFCVCALALLPVHASAQSTQPSAQDQMNQDNLNQQEQNTQQQNPQYQNEQDQTTEDQNLNQSGEENRDLPRTAGQTPLLVLTGLLSLLGAAGLRRSGLKG